MKAVLEITKEKLADLLTAVAEYNGLELTGIEFQNGGEEVAFERVLLTYDHPGLAVRVKESENKQTLSSMLAEVRGSYTIGAQHNGNQQPQQQ